MDSVRHWQSPAGMPRYDTIMTAQNLNEIGWPYHTSNVMDSMALQRAETCCTSDPHIRYTNSTTPSVWHRSIQGSLYRIHEVNAQAPPDRYSLCCLLSPLVSDSLVLPQNEGRFPTVSYRFSLSV